MPPEVVTFGEALAVIRGRGPLRLGGPLELSVAGAEANVAIGLARLGHRCRWVGRVGDDEPGELVRRTLRAEDVDVSFVQSDTHHSTGLLLADQRLNAITQVTYYRSDSAGSKLTADDILPALEPGVRLLHITGITPALSPSARDAVLQAAAAAKELGVTVSLDVNHRARLWSVETARPAIRPLVPIVDILFASVDELPVVARQSPTSDAETVVQHLFDDGLREVIVKRGRAGAWLWTRDRFATVEAKPVSAVDVVGAGDAFVAGYLSGWLDGLTPCASAERGSVTAAFAVTCQGDWEGLPSRRDLPLIGLEQESTIR
ncbi:MAG: sugar kinase [Jatrophihabitans sp.]|uniref:sugar kinase n=1 Tax=Jatrophihabitans sp. TaxID=1932789 RepID=UPI003F7ED928